MASFTGVGDSTEIAVRNKGETVSIAISGTYNMTIKFQRESTPGGDAWETLKTYTTANATVAEDYVTESFNENLRLIVTVDTSGTATATLTEGARTLDTLTLRDEAGRVVAEYTDNTVDFGDRSLLNPSVVSITADTTLTAEEHSNRTLVFNSADGDTVTLPAATGTGNVYKFFVGTTITSNNDVIQVASASDIMQGLIMGADAPGGTTNDYNWGTAADSDTITLGGTSNATGGIQGDSVVLTDIASGVWSVSGFINQGGTEATPFSAAVS